MPSNAIYEILEQHLVSGNVAPGEEIGIRADQMLTQDGTGTMMFLQLEKLGPPRLKGRLAICYVDHNTLGVGPENADDHRFLRSACKKYKFHYSKAGNGIGHQVHLERFGLPHKLLLGADSHVTTLGGLGMLAIGVGGLELVVALTGSPHYLICPEVVQIELVGRLKPFCSAKDVILHLFSRVADRLVVGWAFEYTGPGVETLSVLERATIANMGAELGLTTSLFPADDVTKAFLSSQGRAKDFKKSQPIKNPEYYDTIEVDLASVDPMLSLPHSPLSVAAVKDVKRVKVDQVAIGSCTNGSYEDLAKVAQILKGEKVHPDVELVVAPATRQVWQTLSDRGQLMDLLNAGCRLGESTCGFCIGSGQVPATGAVSVRTSSRNYPGRCGSQDAQVYLVSPETAAATALRGELTDPTQLGKTQTRLRLPQKYPLDDSMIIKPTKSRAEVELIRGPNIGPPPDNRALPASMNCEVALKLPDNISTDDILPAGPYLKYRSNIKEYANYTFSLIDPKFPARARENLEREVYNLIVAGNSYGQGSSREHAAMCPLLLGVRVIIAKSFERIHLSNLVNHGIVPLVFLDQRAYDQIAIDDYLELPWIARELRKSKTISLRNPDKNNEFKVSHSLSRRQIDIILAGGLRNYIASRNKEMMCKDNASS